MKRLLLPTGWFGCLVALIWAWSAGGAAYNVPITGTGGGSGTDATKIAIEGGKGNNNILTNPTITGATIVLSGYGGDFLYATSGLEELSVGTFGSGLTFSGGTLTASGSSSGSSMFLRNTNMVFDGGVSSLYSNVFESTSGGLTNILATNILDGQSVHLWFWASNGVTVNFPQFAASDYPDGAVISANSNCWTHVIIDRRNTVTNISIFTAGLTLNAGNFTEAVTNYATRAITYQNTTRTTNYPTGALTINCATDVRANITNAVASNYAITLATPVLFTSGSLSLVSDASARTLAILCPSSTITWMSTNYTANATNILTTASKRTIFSWRHQLATDGVTTNTACWTYNQF